MAAIEIKNLIKQYGENVAVKGIDLTIEEGEVFALLGPNGAGKSTTVEMLEGHRERTSGDISVLGFDPAKGEKEFRDRIGIVLQETSVEKELTVKEAIEIHGGPYSKRKCSSPRCSTLSSEPALLPLPPLRRSHSPNQPSATIESTATIAMNTVS